MIETYMSLVNNGDNGQAAAYIGEEHALYRRLRAGLYVHFRVARRVIEPFTFSVQLALALRSTTISGSCPAPSLAHTLFAASSNLDNSAAK